MDFICVARSRCAPLLFVSELALLFNVSFMCTCRCENTVSVDTKTADR